MFSHRLSLAAILCAALALPAAPVLAQDRIPISFSRGASGTQINGTIRGNEYIDYVLNARAGQVMDVSLRVTATNGSGTAYFNILPAGQDYGGPYTGHNDDDNHARVTLPSGGDWAIRVYLMGNDRDAGRTVGYSIDVAIEGGAVSGGSAALLPEEDIFVVRVGGGDRLNVRTGPSAQSRAVGALANGTSVANAGGCTMSGGQQWCNIRGAGLEGWVSARFLELPRPGAPAQPHRPEHGQMQTVTGVASNDVLNVRAGPGTGNRVIGALSNGTQVRTLRCENSGTAQWCEIEQLTDMRERGWVNARFLTGGAGAGQAQQPPLANRSVQVRFAPGASGTRFSDEVGPNMRVTYTLGAREGQFLTFGLNAGGVLRWRLFNPDGSLLDEGGPAKRYEGQLWQSGEHRLEVTNPSGAPQSYDVDFGIR